MSNASTWVANKLNEEDRVKVAGRTPEDFLVVTAKNGYTFIVAVLSVQNVIQPSDVRPLFAGATKPHLVVNVPSKTMWSGAAIDFIHAVPAAFGTLGDISRAAHTEAAGSYRHKNMGYFIDAIGQHTNVTSVSYVYDTVFRVDRKDGKSVVVAVIDSYNMSAEDVRNARARLGHFDVVIKSSSYGSITTQAEAAAQSMGAQALNFRELMQRLSL